MVEHFPEEKKPMKPGMKTSESWITVAWNIVCLLMANGVIGGGMVEPGTALVAGGIGTAGYAASRGLAKKNGG
jgi:hypothetical protein